jgi:hypothetical protein
MANKINNDMYGIFSLSPALINSLVYIVYTSLLAKELCQIEEVSKCHVLGGGSNLK